MHREQRQPGDFPHQVPAEPPAFQKHVFPATGSLAAPQGVQGSRAEGALLFMKPLPPEESQGRLGALRSPLSGHMFQMSLSPHPIFPLKSRVRMTV